MGVFPVLVNGRFLTQAVTGVQRYAHEITRQLLRFFPDLKVCVPGKAASAARSSGLPVEAFGRLRGHCWEQLELLARARRDAGTVLVNLCNTGPLGYSRQIVALHDVSFLHEPKWYTRRFYYLYRFLIPRLARRSAHIITVSQFSRRKIVERLKIPSNRVTVVPCAVSEAFREGGQEGAGPERGAYIVAVSSLEPRKNLERLVLAFRELRSAAEELLVVGTTNKTSATSRVKSLGEKTPGVRFYGHTDDVDLARLYRGARASVYPSLYEGFGLPPLEGMACGCPAIVSNVTSLPEVCGEAAYYVDPYSVEDIARGLRVVLGDEDLRDDLRRKGRERARAYSWEESGAALAQIVREVGEGSFQADPW